MSEHYDFHYQPTGSGAISGQQVLQQTEDAINELGDYVNDNVGGAMDVAQQALETAQNAEQDAQTALDTANSFSGAIQSAQQDASTALSTAQTAQTTATNANNTAIQASQDASNAVTTANNASGQVNTLSGTVTALGQRVTTAEGNIGQNTSDITALTTRVGTAEGNITTLQNDVTIAQGNASSAMATAGQVKQQAYVFRYSSTALTPSSTNSNALLDNTDNLKVGDKVIDSNGVLFSVTAIDTANSTFTIGTALIDLANDSDVVHKSGDETVGGAKTFSDTLIIYNKDSSQSTKNLIISSSKIQVGDTSNSDAFGIRFNAGASYVAQILAVNDTTGTQNLQLSLRTKDGSDNFINSMVRSRLFANGNSSFEPGANDSISLGSSVFKWKSVYATNYYYGSNNVEFSTKFVTTDTNQTITGTKTFGSDLTVYNSDTTAYASYLNLKNQRNVRGSTTDIGTQGLQFQDKNSKTLTMLESRVVSNGNTSFNIVCYNTDGNNQTVSDGVSVIKSNTDTCFAPTTDNAVICGRSLAKWSDVKTYKVNTLEPSSLSLPSGNDSDKIDISSYITDLNGTPNLYTPPANGYLTFTFSSGSRVQIYPISGGGVSSMWVSGGSAGIIRGFMPVLKNSVLRIVINATTMVSFYFIPCQGNV